LILFNFLIQAAPMPRERRSNNVVLLAKLNRKSMSTPEAIVTHPPKHFSMLRSFHLADFLTLANAACGVAAILLVMIYVGNASVAHYLAAAALVLAALAFDVFDGRIARWRHSQSALGRELDSLADIISFGVAPAALAFAAGMRGGWDALILIYFVCCGVSRLARYNITAEGLSQGGDKVAYFEGTPIPSSVLLVALLAFFAWQHRLGEHLYGGAWTCGPWVLHPIVLLFLLSGTLMISKSLRIPKL
jgi:CDP-diacylglycerol---serine O-phosphatidyltransferase